MNHHDLADVVFGVDKVLKFVVCEEGWDEVEGYKLFPCCTMLAIAPTRNLVIKLRERRGGRCLPSREDVRSTSEAFFSDVQYFTSCDPKHNTPSASTEDITSSINSPSLGCSVTISVNARICDSGDNFPNCEFALSGIRPATRFAPRIMVTYSIMLSCMRLD